MRLSDFYRFSYLYYMKKKLLITLGCSLTEGVGCYDYTINPDRLQYSCLSSDVLKKTTHRFHTMGWPNRVGKKLGFDRVINYGVGGSANSAHLKIFLEKLTPQIKILKQVYDIYVIWFMTEPIRFSFYTDKRLRLFLPHRRSNPLEVAYLEDMEDLTIGPLREQVFYMKVGESTFRDLGIDYVFSSWSNTFPDLYSLYYTPKFMCPHPHYIRQNPVAEEKSEVCGHPNEFGYETIANKMVAYLEKYHPQFIVGPEKKNMEWDWDGQIDKVNMYSRISIHSDKIL